MKLVLFALLISACVWPQDTPPVESPKPATTTFRTFAQEVLLDFLVRDKRGRMIKDLKPGEIEVLENGVPQKLRELRLVEGWNMTSETEAGPGATMELDPLRQLRLVVIAIDRLGPDSRSMTREAAKALFAKPIEKNVYYMVVQLDPVLKVLRPFSNDRVLLRWAVESATGGAATSYSPESAQVAPPDPSAAQAEEAMQNVIRAIEQANAEMSSQQQGGQSVYGLLSLVSGLRVIEGRKTVLYFADGLQVPPAIQPAFDSLLGTANRTNVSFYAFDTRGVTLPPNISGPYAPGAFTPRPGDSTSLPSAPTPVGVARTTLVINSVHALNLQNLAESTGGALLPQSNDLKAPLQRFSEDVFSYYLTSYLPENTTWDGKFRALTVRVNRPGAVVQARSGYFALPPEVKSILLAHEVPLFKALSTTPLPKQIEYRASAFRFRPAAGESGSMTDCAFHVEVPLSNVTVRKNEAGKTFEAHVSFLVLMKDPAGVIKRKVSRDVPYSGPLDKLDQFLTGNISYNEYFPLAPGRYVMESALVDRIGEKLSAKRQVFNLPEPRNGVSLSSVVLVRRVEPEAAQEENNEVRWIKANDPFRFPGGKVIPSLAASVKGGVGSTLVLYFVVYPAKDVPERPILTLDFLSDGKLVGRATPTLPEADLNGRIPYLATTPLDKMPPGSCQVVVTVRQGASAAQETYVFNVE